MKPDYRSPQPVEPIEPPERYSTTLLQRHDMCPYSAYLALKHGGGTGSAEMHRGSAFHAFAEEAVNTMIETGEATLDPDTAKAMMMGVCDERTDLHITVADRDILRAAAYHWTVSFPVSLPHVVSVERLFTLETPDGLTLSGKPDLVEIEGDTIRVLDYKTSLYYPNQAAVEEDAQVRGYAVLTLFGCPEDGLPLGKGIEWVEVSLQFPRIVNKETGEMMSRTATFSRAEVLQFREDIEASARSLSESLYDSAFVVLPGEPQCDRCVARAECPLPEVLRDGLGSIETAEDAEQAAVRWYGLTREAAAEKKRIKGFATQHGPIRIGDGGLELAFSASESRSVKDWERLEQAVARSVEYGEPFDMDAHVIERKSVRFDKRKVTDAEEVEV